MRNGPESPLGAAIYGDAAEVSSVFGARHPVRGTFEEGLRRCLYDGGKKDYPEMTVEASKWPGLRYWWESSDRVQPSRPLQDKNAKGALNDNGTPVAGQTWRGRGRRLRSVLTSQLSTMCAPTSWLYLDLQRFRVHRGGVPHRGKLQHQGSIRRSAAYVGTEQFNDPEAIAKKRFLSNKL